MTPSDYNKSERTWARVFRYQGLMISRGLPSKMQLPAITGFIVCKIERDPGIAFFTLYG